MSRRIHTKEFKEQAVKLSYTSYESVADLAKIVGVA